MHNLSVYGRLLSRTIVNGLYTNCSNSSNNSPRTNTINNQSETPPKVKPKLVSGVAGFPKDFKNGKVRKGQIGDDAWLITSVHNADVLGNILNWWT